jgi:hypothetical protein
LEAEIKQLQEVLRRRDDEIRVLETAMRSMSGTSPRYESGNTTNIYNKSAYGESMMRDPSSTSTVLSEGSMPMTPKEQYTSDPLLTPTTSHHFGILRQQMDHTDGTDETEELDRVDRLDTLMR